MIRLFHITRLASVLLVCSVTFVDVSGQSAATERNPDVVTFLEAQSKYRNKDGYRMQVRMSSYKGHLSTTPVDTATTVYYKNGRSFYQRSMGTTSIQSDGILAVMIEEDSTIRLGDPIDVRDPFKVYDERQAWSMFTSSSHKVVGGRSTCMLEMSHPEYERLEYTVDDTGWLTRIVLYFREAIAEEDYPNAPMLRPKVVLDLDPPVSFNKGKEAWRFDMSTFVRFDRNGPVSSIQGYRVIDMRVK